MVKFYRKLYIFLIFLILLFCIGSVSADDLDVNETLNSHSLNLNEITSQDDIDDYSIDYQDSLKDGSNTIIVEDWNELKFYASLNDKNYIVKLKENTNYYPIDLNNSDNQIIINNNLTILGSTGSYIGDVSSQARNITYAPIIVPDNSKIGITLQGVTFKWISLSYDPDGVFLRMGGNTTNLIKDCYFENINTSIGHSSIVYIKRGDATLDNCTFINNNNAFGCVGIYDPDDNPTQICTSARMIVTNCYFENNYASTEPGGINNCGVLTVYNTTFYKNRSRWWAGAIHTHGGANTTLYNSKFISNVAGWNGGALYTYSYLQIYNCSFIGNNCTTNNGGGAIGACLYLHSPYIYIENSLFESNENLCWALTNESTTGLGRGGAISIMDKGSLTVLNSTFIKNSASIGTAICANQAHGYGSPDVYLVGNKFINHTRIGDVLIIDLDPSSISEINGNYYINNSIEFTKFKISSDEFVIDSKVNVYIDASLLYPKSYDGDILDKAEYDVYINGEYSKKVTGSSFQVDVGEGEHPIVYVISRITNQKSNEILVGAPLEYIYLSQSLGNDENNASSRKNPVKTLKRAIELANRTGLIMIMDGVFDENNITINYNLIIIGENNSSIVNSTNFNINNVSVTFKNLTFFNLNGSTSFIYQNEGQLIIDDCTFENNFINKLIVASDIEVINSKFKNNTGILINVAKFDITNCIFDENNATKMQTHSLIYSNNKGQGSIDNSIFMNNLVKDGCIYIKNNNANLDVYNSLFLNNSAAYKQPNLNHASCIGFNGGLFNIKSSIFLNNHDIGTSSSIINFKGNGAIIKNSIFLNNSYAHNKGLIISDISNFIANGNWWGNTLNNYSTCPKMDNNIVCENWIILNAYSNATSLNINQLAQITFDFNNVYDKNTSSIILYNAKEFPNLNLTISTINGKADYNSISIVNGKAKIKYNLTDYDDGVIIASYNVVNASVYFNFTKINPEIQINGLNITWGDVANITVNAPYDINEELIININNQNYTLNLTNGKGFVMILDLPIGKYNLTLYYSGNIKYENIIILTSLTVNKLIPEMIINVDDVNVGSDVEILVKLPNEAKGNVTLVLGNITENKTLVNGEASFILSNLKANKYNLVVIYSGEDYYYGIEANKTFFVNKINSTVAIEISDVEFGYDVNITAKVLPDATGNVTIKINNEEHVVDIVDAKAIFTINSITSGDYEVVVIYNGDDKYLTSQNQTLFSVNKIKSNFTIKINGTTYGNSTTFEVTLNNGATGDVTIIVDGIEKMITLKNSKAIIIFDALNAGIKTAKIIYSGDENYTKNITSISFNIKKVIAKINIIADNIMLDHDEVISFTSPNTLTGSVLITVANKTFNKTIGFMGRIPQITLSDLPVGYYNVSVNYSGDSNYLTAVYKSNFTVQDYETPQFPQEGYDGQNSGKIPYNSDSNANNITNFEFEGNYSSMVIDAKGNIYISAGNKIYSFYSNGTQRWIFQPWGIDSFSGLAISRDVIIAPKPGDTLYFINATTGNKYGSSNIYQGSSKFAPVVDSNANIYIASEYQYSERTYYLVIIPYKSWEYGGELIKIETGDAPISAPVLLHNDLVAINTNNSIKIINITSKSVIISKGDVNVSARPIVSSSNIIFVFDKNSIVAMSVGGVEIWKANVTGGVGSNLAIDDNGGVIYSVNSEGVLYKYDINDGGKSSVFANITEKFTSNVLIDNNGNIYVGTQEGMFYALSREGEVLWKANLSSLSNVQAMNRDGIVYVHDGLNTIKALANGQKIESNITANTSDVNYGSPIIIDINIDDEATGNLTFILNNEEYIAKINNGQAKFVIKNLTSGNYSINMKYSGDLRFNPSNKIITFNVKKIDIQLAIEFDNLIVEDEIVIINVTLDSNATGDVVLFIDGKNLTKTINNSFVTFEVSNLTFGIYNFTVTYVGSIIYNAKSISDSLTVKEKKNPSFNISKTTYGEFNITLNDDKGKGIANENITLIVENNLITSKTNENGVASFNLDLNVGNHKIIVKFKGNKDFKSITLNSSLNVLSTIIVQDLIRGYNSKNDFQATFLSKDGKILQNTNITFRINGKNYEVTTNFRGIAILNVKLAIGKYVVIVINNFTGEKSSKNLEISKRLLENKDMTIYFGSGKYYKIKVIGDNGKVVKSGEKVIFKINKKTYIVKTDKKGYASLKITLNPKKYLIIAEYKGYKVENNIVVKPILTAKNISKKKSKTIKFNAKLVNVKGKAWPKKVIKFKFKGKTYKVKTNSRGVATLSLKNLKVGKYTIFSIYGKSKIKNTVKIKK